MEGKVFKEVVIETTKEVSKDLYTDLAKPTMKNVGGFLGTLVGFFDKVVVYPLKKLNIEYEQKAIAFQREMEKKYNNIPLENRCEPKINIVGPALEALKFNLLEDELREMFKNLLVNSLDDRKINYCIPSYVKIMEQLSVIDAKVLRSLHLFGWETIHYLTFKISFECEKGNKQTFASQQYITEDLKLPYSLQEISASLANLDRLGLITISSRYLIPKENFSHILNRSEVKEKIEKTKSICGNSNNVEMEINYSGIIEFSDFANGFKKICSE